MSAYLLHRDLSYYSAVLYDAIKSPDPIHVAALPSPERCKMAHYISTIHSEGEEEGMVNLALSEHTLVVSVYQIIAKHTCLKKNNKHLLTRFLWIKNLKAMNKVSYRMAAFGSLDWM